jgi:endonuclease/exonuclease/phosphatase family metal-dependent hydrolase
MARQARRALVLALAVLSVSACVQRQAAVWGGESADTVRVVVYNMHAGKDAAGVDNLQRIVDVVRAARADVVLLQEVDQGTRRSGGVDQPAVLARRSGFHVAFGSALDYDGGKYGVATLSRWPITFDTLYRLPVDPPQERAGGSREPRGMLRTDIASPHGTITLFNTHIDASREDTWRRQEASAIVAIVTAARVTRPLVLLGGDMNSTPESAVQELVRGAGLRDAFSECGHGAGLTFPSDSAVKRIDYLYLTGVVRCARAEAPATTISDHRPLIVDVTIVK